MYRIGGIDFQPMGNPSMPGFPGSPGGGAPGGLPFGPAGMTGGPQGPGGGSGFGLDFGGIGGAVGGALGKGRGLIQQFAQWISENPEAAAGLAQAGVGLYGANQLGKAEDRQAKLQRRQMERSFAEQDRENRRRDAAYEQILARRAGG